MSKRKKLRTSGEGIRPPKHPKLRDSDEDPPSFQFGPSGHPEESKSRSGPVPCTEQSEEESGQEASSSLDKEPGAPCRLLSQAEKEPIPFPPSQNSDRRFVPQFAKPRKTVTRLTTAREEDLGSGAFSSETPPEPSAQRAGSQSWQESSELTVLEAWKPGDQTQADGTHSEPSAQNSVTPVSSRGDSQPEVSNDISSEWGMVSLVSESANRDYLLEQGANLPDAGSTEGGRIPGDLSQEGHLPSRGAEEKEPDRGVPQEEGVLGGIKGGDQEKGDSILGLITQGSEPGSAAQAPPDPLQILSRVGIEARGSCSSPGHSSLRISVITDVVTDPTKAEQRALELTGPDEKANTQASASPNGKAPDGGHSGALLTGSPLAGEATGSRGEAEWEAEAPGDVSRSPAASLVLAHETQEPSIGAGYSSPVASEMGPVVGQTQVPELDQEGLGGVSLLSQPSGEKAAELGSQSHEQDLGGFSLSLGASDPPLHRESVVGPLLDARALEGSPDAPASPAGQPKHPDPADQAALELDFLPDSQIQDALEALNFEAPPEQFPAVSGADPCWPDTSLSTEGGPLIHSQPSTHKGIQPCEATRMEDATDTMRGLIIELSNLNRLIMNAHRDLEAFKRLNYRKTKPAGKAPMPYPSKGAGALPRGEQPWRDL
ncbi:break repair meiotic recombinase recruitment factor 1 isoform X1 [Pipistrellus kuhlii]|uniref:break repair meiotic recombinase recruitment factor 1 isoform X1 n=1 Tax=Pipistrellus kuhlii TaxID=59472 RepID=UPI00174F06BC|nr:break repair meiotic recombinase recruitment factor 1 isoform X1 [Pipistrellus kuhlii]